MPDGWKGLTVRTVGIRLPEPLIQAVEALLLQRQEERPFEVVKQGDLLRELLTRGLESVAAEKAR